MFTGIIEEVGTVEKIIKGRNSAVVYINAKKILEDINVGDSIAVNGICLTVKSFNESSFIADIMHESLERSSLKNLKTKDCLNLERAMPVNGRFGGHIVSGHVDGTGEIVHIKSDDNAIWYRIKTKDSILKYIVEKGSITIDGISLTVAKMGREDFSVSIIPHTLDNTVLKYKTVGDTVNLENDIVGKYIEKFIGSEKSKSCKINEDFLIQHGFI